MKKFSAPEYNGVWFPYQEDRLVFREVVQYFLRSVLKDQTGLLEVKDDGPYWIGKEKIELSYAHTPGAAVLVYSSTHKLGVDIEPASREFTANPMKIASRFYHPSETAEIQKVDEISRKMALLKLWVKKEAYAKLTRLGLSKTMANALPDDLNAKTLPETPEGFLSCVLFEKI